MCSENAGETINVNLFWGTVTSMIDAEKGIYGITDKNETPHWIERFDLRHGKRHSRVFGHISDDKSRDRHAMQHFTNHELKELELYTNEHYPEDIPTGKLDPLHQHSDNASQHFKSTGSLHFFTTLINDRGGPANTAYIYTFGLRVTAKALTMALVGDGKPRLTSAVRQRR